MASGRIIQYRQIADRIEKRVTSGEFQAGRLLPSEASLSSEYGVSRVTIRRSLEALRDLGLVDSRQGYGWFVAADPVQQSLGKLRTIEEQIERQGTKSERRILEFAFIDAPARAREVLGVDRVLQVERLNLADGVPFAHVTVWCPEDLATEFSRSDVERSTLYDLMPQHPASAVQIIDAEAVSSSDSELLAIPPHSPVLVCERISKDAAGANVLLSRHVFPAHLTQFVVELPHVPSSVAPSGLRLVESGE